ncbi:hypothetical protein ACKLNR_014494 [Fusarium oxysporum f. sp. zingiberi]
MPGAKESPIKAEGNITHLEDSAEFGAPHGIGAERKGKSNDGPEGLQVPEQMREHGGEKPVEVGQDIKIEGGTMPAKEGGAKDSPAAYILSGALGNIQKKKRKFDSDDESHDSKGAQRTKRQQLGKEGGLSHLPKHPVPFGPRNRWKDYLRNAKSEEEQDIIMEDLYEIAKKVTKKGGRNLKQYACGLNDAPPELRRRYLETMSPKDKEVVDEHFWNMFQRPDLYDPSQSFPKILTPRILDNMTESWLQDKSCCICDGPFADWDRYVKKNCGRHIMHYMCPEEKEEKKLGIFEEGKCGCQRAPIGTQKG